LKKNLLTPIAFLFTFLVIYSTSSFAQAFEGIIVFKTSVELPENSSISEAQFKVMFNDIDTVAHFFLKNSNYKLVTLDNSTNEPKTISQFESDSNKTFSYMAGQNDFCMVSIYDPNQPDPKISIDPNDTITVLGLMCKSLEIDYGISKSIVYFSEKHKVDKRTFKANPSGFLEYLYRTGALPLKIIMSGNGAVHNMVFTATEIKEAKLKDTELEVPNFKQVMKSPY
jgi:hypothetical protein